MSEQNKVAVAKALKDIQEQQPAFIELVKFRADSTRRAYLELIQEGFDSNQALELCTKILPF